MRMDGGWSTDGRMWVIETLWWAMRVVSGENGEVEREGVEGGEAEQIGRSGGMAEAVEG
jgi:hypothetical protein